MGVLAGACHTTRPGDPCKADADCGAGFDCWQQRCARVCATPEQCGPGETCTRYRCVAVSGPVPGGLAPARAERPPEPDDAAAELRAIRQELELLRQGQQRILEALEQEKAERARR